ncbi:MAG: 7-carboxy-7-deazaguanine synthase QueE [Campylobacterales bacterium]|nr:7-carboxy-7-deazaguanine synthase QueE [Campylobacterales bacterium]
MLEVNEIFGPTIQGEGKRVGNPSVFIRFGKCNMSCSGFEVEYETPSGIKKCSCDSFHASDIAFRDLWSKYEFSKPLIEEVNKLIPHYKVDIVITGGEPLLYWNDMEFQKLLKYYIDLGFHITIETNASIFIPFSYQWQKKILFSMSVKLSNSGESEAKRINPKALENIINFVDESYLKFVIDKEFIPKASLEIDAILNQIPKCDVYLMPMGDTAKIIDQNALSVIELALEKGYKYSDRLHVRVWNNKRGV